MKILHCGLTACGEPLNGFQKAMINVCKVYREINNASTAKTEEIIRVNKEEQPNIIFFQYQGADIIPHSVLHRIKEDNPNSFVVNFTGDVRHPLPQWYIDFGKHIDCTLFSNVTDVYEARRLGINAEFLQYGYDPEIYNPLVTTSHCPEIVFLGNNYHNQFPLSIKRSEMVRFLKREYGNRFAVYGTNWDGTDGNFMGDQKGEASIYRGCKIAINYSHFDYERYSSDRLFRIMGTGAFCLSHRYPGIHIDFEVGKNLAVFDTLEHLKAQIDFYLNDDQERIRIAENGNKHALKNFTFDAMIQNLLKIYYERKKI